MMSTARITLFIGLVTLGILSKECTTSLKISVNKTQALNDDESPIEEKNLRERFRRLIPYMTYYLLNNYVGGQQHQQQPLLQHQTPTLRRPPTSSQVPALLVPLKSVQQQLGKSHRYYKLQEERFVPSVQYDPKEMSPDVDYFVPMRYSNKGAQDSYEDYSTPTQQTPRPASLPFPVTVQDTRYQSSPRPVVYPVRKLIPTKPPPQDYAYDEAPEEFESVRYVPVKPRMQQQRYMPRPTILEPVQNVARVSLNHVLKSLQLTNQLPEVLSKDNIDSSIRTLVEILNILNMGKKENYAPIYAKPSTYTKPKVITESNYEATQISVTPHNELIDVNHANSYINNIKSQLPHPQEVVEIKPARPYIKKGQSQSPVPKHITTTSSPIDTGKIIEYYVPVVQDIDVEKETSYQHDKVPEATPITEDSNESNYDIQENDEILEDERFTLPVTTTEESEEHKVHVQNIIPPSLKYGATRGKPHIDYPAYTEIPETDFSCKQQRYKGFFGDPATGCQVWHYCDLNGGKSSFLCPNGTIFSQVALTCDWWFNVKCESTTQLYVLNERLYKYILPIIPKFPEDFTGPEVDKYLELKFKEMEAKLKEKKMKKEEEEEKDKSTLNTLQSIEDSK